MFKKSILVAALLLASSAAFISVDAKPLRQVMGCDPSNAPGGVCVIDPSNIRDHRTPQNIRDHRCPASQGGNCVGPEVQVVVPPPPPPPNQQPPGCGVAGCNPPPPPPPKTTECNDPRICDDFGQNRPYRITCGQGRSIVRHSGYRRVRPIDCSGRQFTYMATRHGEVYGVVVNMRGRIVDVYEAP